MEGFPDILSPKRQVLIQNESNKSRFDRHILLPKVVRRFKRFELYLVWRVHTQAMWSQPETTHSFPIAVAANIQDRDQRFHSNILQSSLSKMKSITGEKLMLKFGERQELSRKQERVYQVFQDNRK